MLIGGRSVLVRMREDTEKKRRRVKKTKQKSEIARERGRDFDGRKDLAYVSAPGESVGQHVGESTYLGCFFFPVDTGVLSRSPSSFFFPSPPSSSAVSLLTEKSYPATSQSPLASSSSSSVVVARLFFSLFNPATCCCVARRRERRKRRRGKLEREIKKRVEAVSPLHASFAVDPSNELSSEEIGHYRRFLRQTCLPEPLTRYARTLPCDVIYSTTPPIRPLFLLLMIELLFFLLLFFSVTPAI